MKNFLYTNSDIIILLAIFGNLDPSRYLGMDTIATTSRCQQPEQVVKLLIIF